MHWYANTKPELRCNDSPTVIPVVSPGIYMFINFINLHKSVSFLHINPDTESEKDRILNLSFRQKLYNHYNYN